MTRISMVAVLALVASVAAAQEGEPRKPKDPAGSAAPRERTPPTQIAPIEGETWIGMRAHDFELDGSLGQPVKLSNLRGSWVVLAFSDRKNDLKKLKGIDAEMRSIGARLVGVCHEKSHGLGHFARRDSIPFLMLADPTGQVCSIYGLYNHARDETIPGLLILDHEGYVRMMLLGRIPPADQTARLARFAVTEF